MKTTVYNVIKYALIAYPLLNQTLLNFLIFNYVFEDFWYSMLVAAGVFVAVLLPLWAILYLVFKIPVFKNYKDRIIDYRDTSTGNMIALAFLILFLGFVTLGYLMSYFSMILVYFVA